MDDIKMSGHDDLDQSGSSGVWLEGSEQPRLDAHRQEEPTGRFLGKNTPSWTIFAFRSRKCSTQLRRRWLYQRVASLLLDVRWSTLEIGDDTYIIYYITNIFFVSNVISLLTNPAVSMWRLQINMTQITSTNQQFMVSSKIFRHDRTTVVGPTGEDEMCNFYMMYWVQGKDTIQPNTCFTR